MEIHRYEKLWLAASLLLIVGFIATVTYGAVGLGIEMVDDDGGTVDPETVGESGNFSDPGVTRLGPDRYAVHVLARKFFFQPSTVRVPADSTVTFYVTSGDVTHGFEVVGTNVNAMVIPGQVTKLTVEFDEAETYGIVCNEYCGSAHHTMAGTLEVVPQDQFSLNTSGGA